MADNKKLLHTFFNFVKSKRVENFSKEEVKLINMIVKNIDSISVVGTAAGKRGKLLNALMLKEWVDLSEELSVDVNQNDQEDFPIDRLYSIDIDHFRGFSSPFNFKFEKPYTLIYGTNGSGKTSFCEALEYSMLGYINEAESKRIPVIKYVTNIVTGKAAVPILRAIDKEGKEVVVNPSPNNFHFSFIERNRIDGFARISANTPSDQGKLLSTLFGLEEFNSFVSEFTDNIEKYVDVEGLQSKILSSKNSELEKYKHAIGSAEQSKKELIDRKKSLAVANNFEMTFDEIDTYLHGSAEFPGRLKEIDVDIQNLSTSQYDTHSLALLTIRTDNILSQIENYRVLKIELDLSKDNVNYRKLYSAVKELKYNSNDKCPACLTPLDAVVINPFENAKKSLVELEKLATLEQKIESIVELIVDDTKEIIKDVRIKNKFAKELGATFELVISPELGEITKHSINEVLEKIVLFVADIKRNTESLTFLDNILNRKNEEFEKSTEFKKKLSLEREEFQKISTLVKDIKSKETVFNETILGAQTKISEFTLENQSLLQEVDKEKKQITVNIQFVNVYKSLIGKLKAHVKELPGKLISDMNDLVRDFYNEINKHDFEYERLSKIELPSKSQDIIKAYFKDNPSKPVDALHVLSEGHVRCLGLAILLAKIVKDNIGIIIFDDVVNAIDDDHRGGIRELLLGNNKLNKRQIILTSHAEEFIKDLENQVEKRKYEDYIKRITFLPPEERNINVDLLTSSNYLSLAQSALDKSQKRECLRNCRSALENINSALWKRLARTYNTSITVQIRQPKGMPDSMTTVTGLSQFLKKTVKDSKYDKVVEIYDYLRGLEATHNSVWNYLNKGTHEEEGLPEFDLLIVRELYSKLELLDSEAKAV
ncbi:AAA family ATPase [Paenibacillus vandeheii]